MKDSKVDVLIYNVDLNITSNKTDYSNLRS